MLMVLARLERVSCAFEKSSVQYTVFPVSKHLPTCGHSDARAHLAQICRSLQPVSVTRYRSSHRKMGGTHPGALVHEHSPLLPWPLLLEPQALEAAFQDLIFDPGSAALQQRLTDRWNSTVSSKGRKIQ